MASRLLLLVVYAGEGEGKEAEKVMKMNLPNVLAVREKNCVYKFRINFRIYMMRMKDVQRKQMVC